MIRAIIALNSDELVDSYILPYKAKAKIHFHSEKNQFISPLKISK
jgi:hypothetical protein